MRLRIPTSIEDFCDLREGHFEYIDKTHLITEFIERDNFKVILLPRPPRFGKSLNLSTLKWFFEKREENVWHLFEGLAVARAGEKYRRHFQRYPLIHMSFKETKAEDLAGCQEAARRAIRKMFEVHRSGLEGMLEGGEKTLEKAMAEGLVQLAENDYAAELRAAGVEKIREMVVGFDGKRVMVLPKGAKPPRKKGAVKKAGAKSKKDAG